MSSRLDKLLEFHENDTNDEFVRYGIALEYKSMQKFEEAVRWLEGLRQEVPHYLPTYFMLGETYLKLKKKEEAKQVLKDGITLAKQLHEMHTLGELRHVLHKID